MRAAGGVLIGFSLAHILAQEGVLSAREGSGVGSQQFGIEPEKSSSVVIRGRVARDVSSGWENFTFPVSFLAEFGRKVQDLEAKMNGVGDKVLLFGNSEQVRVYISCF